MEIAPNIISIEYDPDSKYPELAPFSPSEKYPEYPFSDVSASRNPVYDQLRKLMLSLSLDSQNRGKENWNPLGEIIVPGNKVVIKPNWVRETNPISEGIDGLVTHPALIRAIVDYAIIALKNDGEIIIGDAPIQSADFDILKNRLKIQEIADFYQTKTSVRISVEDFRQEIRRYGKGGEVIFNKIFSDKEFVKVDLGDKSSLASVIRNFKKFRVTNYDPKKMSEFHGPGKNVYLIYKSVLDADVVIQVPKLKTHRKAGLTCCLKNTVGINCSKDALVHHTKGSKWQGGDAYSEFNLLKWLNEEMYDLRESSKNTFFQKLLTKFIGLNETVIKRLFDNMVFEGSWYGNDTLWRMILDINMILFFSDKNGRINESRQRKVMYFVDCIVGGENNGPLKPSDKQAGLLIAGWNPVLIDIAAAKMMGFDYRRIPVLLNALRSKLLDFNEDKMGESNLVVNGKSHGLSDLDLNLNFEPAIGWKNHIEI